MPDSEIHNTHRVGWLRAAVLGANDGIVSTASLVLGVAAAGTSSKGILIAGIAGLVAGAMSMAAGEYVSVSSQRDLEEAELEREKAELSADPQCELAELGRMLEGRGIDPPLARKVARQLTNRDALAAHASLELGIDPTAVANPWSAALASMTSFTVGGLVPLLSMVLAPRAIEIWISGAAVLVALTLTGWISAKLGGAPRARSILRNVTGGLLAMAITYGIGKLAGTQL